MKRTILKELIPALLITFCLLILSFPLQAKIVFSGKSSDTIDIETLNINKKQFLEFLGNTITSRKPGLGKYGRVAFYPCDYKIDERRLIDYKTPAGKEIKFMTNPSCHQIVLRRVLENSYRYNVESLSSYGNRQCILSVEKIISPILEYYTIKFEENKDNNCSSCPSKEQTRLDRILATQKKIIERCSNQADNVMSFIEEIDALTEKTYRTKSNK